MSDYEKTATEVNVATQMNEEINKSPELVLDLCCRRCGEQFHLPTNAARDVITTTMCAQNHKEPHQCKDGSVGIADLLGFTDRSTPSPPALPLPWVRQGTVLKSKNTNVYAKVCLVNTTSNDNRFIVSLFSDDGNRWFTPFETESKTIDGYNYFNLSSVIDHFST